jgi:hypothetical protein
MTGSVAISPTKAIADEQPKAARGDRALVDRLGGRRGLLDGALPPAVFVLVHAASPSVGGSEALRPAVAAALTTGAVLIVVRLLRREALMSALRGLAGLAVAVLFAVASGEARDFFLPGIVVDAAYAVVFAGSTLVGRPLVGAVHAALYGTGPAWREDGHLRSIFTIATLGWTLVFTIRASVQVAFYLGDVPGLLAVSKLALGWPLTGAAVVLTLAYLRRVTARP